MGRATLFRSPPFTLGRVTGPAGFACEWTTDLAPLGERTVVPGQLVELHARVDASAGGLDPAAPLTFDVLAAGPSGEPEGAPLVRLAGRTPVERELEPGQDVAAARMAFVAQHPADLDAQLLIVREPAAAHAITWWRVDPGAARALHFTVDADGRAARTTQAMRVGAADAGARTLQFELRGEDGAPMAEAVVEAAFEGGLRARATTGADGRVTVALPPGASEVFRVFLISYREAPPVEPPDRPDPPDRPVLPVTVDTRPEVVAAFAFDSSFPSPAVHASLLRVRAKAATAREAKLIVFGHTDPVGSDTYNIGLADRRARAVLALLLDDRELFEAVAAAEGWDTRAHQAMLWGVGCNPGAIDGDAGELTRIATANFQREHNAGVYHERAVVARERPTLAFDGELGPATRAALRDAYVAVAPHVRADRFAEPAFDGCGEAHLISDRDDENRRAVVAFLGADVDLSQSSACERYAELVGETPEDRRGPPFSDHQWLQEESGALHLSAATPVPDGTPARIRVVRCDRTLPVPLPDSSGGGAPPALGPTLAELTATIAGGVCAARWPAPDPAVLDPEAWLVDHDVELEIVDAAGHEAPAPGDPASGAALLAADGTHPPVFLVEADERWSVSGPPAARLERLRVGPASDGLEAVEEGLALRPDGTLVRFAPERGLPDPDEPADVLAVAVLDHDVPGAVG